MPFEFGNKVWLLTWRFWQTRLSKTLDYNHTRPYTVSKIINKNAYKLDLPKTIQNHNIFHVLQLDYCTVPFIEETSSEEHWVMVNDLEKCEVEQIQNCLQHCPQLQYIHRWAPYSLICMSCEQFEHHTNACDLWYMFTVDRPTTLWRWKK